MPEVVPQTVWRGSTDAARIARPAAPDPNAATVAQADSQRFQSRRHDILAALSLYALQQPASDQRRMLRLILLLTARYNWRSDRLAMGRNEIARLWGVDPRTVRRDMARLRQRGWLVIRQAAARGRVTVYGLGRPQLLADLAPFWQGLGPDFALRGAALQAEIGGSTASGRVTDQTRRDPKGAVIPFRMSEDAGPGPVEAFPVEAIAVRGSPADVTQPHLAWARMQAYLTEHNAAMATAWFDRLVVLDHGCDMGDPGEPGDMVAERVLCLAAPSAFVARYIEERLLDQLEHARRHVACGFDRVALSAPLHAALHGGALTR